MEREKLVAQLQRLLSKIRPDPSVEGVLTESIEFLRLHTDSKNAFISALQKLDPQRMDWAPLSQVVRSNLEAQLALVEAGVHEGVSARRQGELNVVSDFLEMAHELLNAPQVHAAAAAMVVGATLEEFLRTWIEEKQLSLGSRKPGLDAYAATLREGDLISKQDVKDITSWAGTRNHAAHGEWDSVGSKERVRLMLDGVNLFIRQHSMR